MTKYEFTPQAADDLFEIWKFIAQDNPEAANRVEKAIYLACDFLVETPLAGRVREDLTALPVRFWLVPGAPSFRRKGGDSVDLPA